ncbi:MAG: V-type ATP synthase subunit D [Lentisphaeria bacterium]|jgi:V/A-type H+-transporting ATPase subunit D
MARLNTAPTKSNLQSLKRDLALATEGFSLLDQKREILVLELMRLLEQVREARRQLEARRQAAYATLKKAATANGYHQLRATAAGIRYEHRVREGQRIVAGVRVPDFGVEHGEFRSQFGFAGTDSLVDRTMAEFLELLKAVSRMAQLETAVWQLARELKKTQRRVNALEQLFIPAYQDTRKWIQETLEGKELESFFVLKLLKKKLAAVAEGAAGDL